MTCCQFCKARDIPYQEPSTSKLERNNDETAILLGDSKYQAQSLKTSHKFSLFVIDSDHQLTCCERATTGCLKGTKDLKNYVASAVCNPCSLVIMGVVACVTGGAGFSGGTVLATPYLNSTNCGTCCAAAAACSGATLASAVLGACAVGGTISIVALICKLSQLSKVQAQTVIKQLVTHVNTHGATQKPESTIITQPERDSSKEDIKETQARLLAECLSSFEKDDMKTAVQKLTELQEKANFPMTIVQNEVDKGTEYEITTKL